MFWRDSEHLAKVILTAGGVTALLILAGVLWVAGAVHRSALRQADLYLLHPAPLRLTGGLSVSATVAGHTDRAWATCASSAHPAALRAPERFRPVGGAALDEAARSLEDRLGAAGEDGQTGRDLAWALRRWPRQGLWLDPQRGVLVAMDTGGRVVCLLVTTVPLPGAGHTNSD